MKRLIAIGVLLLTACKGGDAEDQPTDKSTGGSGAPKVEAAGAFDKLKVTIDGKPVAIANAFLKKISPDRFQLYLSNKGGSCRELLDNVFNGGDDSQIDVIVDLTPRLAADGSQTIEVSYIYEGGSTVNIAPGSKATVGGAADPGSKTAVDIDFSGSGDLAMEVHGSLVAEGCGFDPPSNDGVPKAAHPSTATITIAGKQLAIKSAIVKGDEVAPPKVRDLVLSTGPKDCSSTTPWAEIIVERHWGAWTVSGTWLADSLSASMQPDEGTKALVATLGATGTSDDGPTVAVELGGEGTLEGYTFALAGTVEAIDCGK